MTLTQQIRRMQRKIKDLVTMSYYFYRGWCSFSVSISHCTAPLEAKGEAPAVEAAAEVRAPGEKRDGTTRISHWKPVIHSSPKCKEIQGFWGVKNVVELVGLPWQLAFCDGFRASFPSTAPQGSTLGLEPLNTPRIKAGNASNARLLNRHHLHYRLSTLLFFHCHYFMRFEFLDHWQSPLQTQLGAQVWFSRQDVNNSPASWSSFGV